LFLNAFYFNKISVDPSGLDPLPAKAINSMDTLESITVQGTDIHGKGAIEITNAVLENSDCTNFSLYGGYINDRDAIEISELLTHSNLASLTISSANIGNSSERGLKPASGTKALISNVAINSIEVITSKHIPDQDKIVLAEKNPVTRVNYGRELGIAVPVPSLLKLSLFAVKQILTNPQPHFKNEDAETQFVQDLELLGEDLKSQLSQY
jgi:hypothetical protein